MSIRELRYLIALADCLSFTRAADRCAVTQSTLSIQLRKLEDYLGVRLFDRNRSRVSLTAEGNKVLELARVAVRAADEIVLIGRRARKDADAAHQAEPLIEEINRPRLPRG
jgi:LysR family hydrogen peroxide-inducible transcriptional activator